MSNRLLLADDSVTIQKVVGIIFSNEDYELAVVDNGNAALEKAREFHPDIMLVDALMPGIDGYEVCREIRRDPALKNTPLLLLTGAFEPFDEDKARQCGADDFISKPFDSQSLIESVKKLIANGRERATVSGEQAVPVQAAEPASDWAVEELVEFTPEPLAAAAPPATEAVAEPTLAAAEDDLWGAFELEAGDGAEPAVEIAGEEAIMAGFEEPSADDAFSFAEPEPVPEPAAPDFGSNWVPVGEQEFGYDEPAPGEPAPSLASLPLAAVSVDAVEPSSFPESSFTTSAVEASAFGGFEGVVEPVSAAIPMDPVEPVLAPVEEFVPAPAAMVPAEPAVEHPAVSAIPATVALDEAQLKALLASVSREVIEKIVWEVVPDLAETIIKEEIRKIKEGIGD